MKITGTNITIIVKDMDASISFYTSIGFILENRWGNYYAQLSAPGITIGLHPRSAESPAEVTDGNISIGLMADQFEEAVSLLQNLRIPYQERVEEGGEFLHFSDPDHTSLYFIKPKWN